MGSEAVRCKPAAFCFFVFRIIVYIDGFNLYYRALKATRHKWLNISALMAAVLPPGGQQLRVGWTHRLRLVPAV